MHLLIVIVHLILLYLRAQHLNNERYIRLTFRGCFLPFLPLLIYKKFWYSCETYVLIVLIMMRGVNSLNVKELKKKKSENFE